MDAVVDPSIWAANPAKQQQQGLGRVDRSKCLRRERAEPLLFAYGSSVFDHGAPIEVFKGPGRGTALCTAADYGHDECLKKARKPHNRGP